MLIGYGTSYYGTSPFAFNAALYGGGYGGFYGGYSPLAGLY